MFVDQEQRKNQAKDLFIKLSLNSKVFNFLLFWLKKWSWIWIFVEHYVGLYSHQQTFLIRSPS